MFVVLIVCALAGTSSGLSMEARTPVFAETNQSTLLPVSYRFSQLKTYFKISWRFVSRNNNLIIMESRRNCSAQGGSVELVCLEHAMDYLDPEYRHRVELLANASLLIHHVGPEDAGTYEVSIQALDVSAMKFINLTVVRGPESRAAQPHRDFTVHNVLRLGVAALLLCLLLALLGKEGCDHQMEPWSGGAQVTGPEDGKPTAVWTTSGVPWGVPQSDYHRET